jgi:hypothetical protein
MDPSSSPSKGRFEWLNSGIQKVSEVFMNKFLLLSILMSTQLFAQDQSYELKGNLGNTSGKKPVEFTLSWTEKEGIARGYYKDNYYGSTDLVKGITSDLGRIFLVTFPKETHGARSLMIVGPEIKDQKEEMKVPVSLIARDDKGNPIRTMPLNAKLAPSKTMPAQAQETQPCGDDFGELAGVCGIYAGITNEERDINKRCDLMAENALRLGISDNGSVVILMGPGSEIVETPAHNVGRLPANAASRRVSVINRECRPLAGTTFAGDDCKLLDLSGEFTEEKGRMHFSGTYTITNEKNRETCRYRFSLDQDA